jgi:hypothetical protein
MVGEALAAAVVGLIALWLVFQPLLRPSPAKSPPIEPVDPEETPKGVALAALKEIEFDRETGKLSDADYEFLKAKYTAAALAALRLETPPAGEAPDAVEVIIAAKVRALRSASTLAPSDAPAGSTDSTRSCSRCGPRPEPDAVFCSTCGRPLPGRSVCDRCGAALQPDSRFCEACGRQVAA